MTTRPSRPAERLMRCVQRHFTPWSALNPISARTLRRRCGWGRDVEGLQRTLDELVARGDLVAYTFDEASTIGAGVVGERQYRPR